MNTPKDFSPIRQNEGYEIKPDERKAPTKPQQAPTKDFKKLSQDKDLKSKKFDDVVEDDFEMDEEADVLVTKSPPSLYQLAAKQEPASQPAPKAKVSTRTEAMKGSYSRSSQRTSKNSHEPTREAERGHEKERIRDRDSIDEIEEHEHIHEHEDIHENEHENLEAFSSETKVKESETEIKEKPPLQAQALPNSMLAEAAKEQVQIGRPAFESEVSKPEKREKPISTSIPTSTTPRTDFAVQQPIDLTAQNTQFTTTRPEVARANPATTIQQLVEQITVVVDKGQTNTEVTLKNIAGFEGATIKVTQDVNAPGQINITFANIQLPESEALLRNNLDSLTSQLQTSQKIVVQQVIITARPETIISTEPKPAEREGQQGGQTGGGGSSGGQRDQGRRQGQR